MKIEEKSLHFPRRTRHPHGPLRPKKRTPVTIIIGFITQTAVIVASDSQKSFDFSSKRTDEDKMRVLRFADKGMALVAQSGDVAITSRLLELMQENAASTNFDHYRKAALCAEQAMRVLKAEILEPLMPELSTLQERGDFFMTKDASLMIASYFSGIPKIFTINLAQGIAIEHTKYASIGCGSTVAEFMARWLDIPLMDWVDAIPSAVYIIEEVKKVDHYCGGQTKLAYITASHGDVFRDPPFTILTPQQIGMIVQELAEPDKKIKENWRDEMLSLVSRASKKLNAILNPPPTEPQPPSDQSPDAGPSTTPQP